MNAVKLLVALSVLSALPARADDEVQLEKLKKIFSEEMKADPQAAAKAHEILSGWTKGHPEDAAQALGALEKVKRKAKTETVDAAGVVILIDRSGSMDSRPTKGKGRKIDGAVAAANNALKKIKEFKARNSDRDIRVAVLSFEGLSANDEIKMQAVSADYPEVPKLSPGGGTPIGRAMVEAKLRLNAEKVRRGHILVITDGENTEGPGPLNVLRAFNLLPTEEFPIVHFVAFDIDAGRFHGFDLFLPKVYEAGDSAQLDEVLAGLVDKEILPEKPSQAEDK